jgi:hypothetical protein
MVQRLHSNWATQITPEPPTPEIRRPGDSWRQALEELPPETSQPIQLSVSFISSFVPIAAPQRPMLEVARGSGAVTAIRGIPRWVIPLVGGLLLLSCMLVVALTLRG